MKIKAIKEFLGNRYTPNEYPALSYQLELWSIERPLENVKILDGTPVFANTLLKYANLLSAGCDLTVGFCDDIPYDKNIIDLLQKIGVKTVYDCSEKGLFDVVIDCNAHYRKLEPHYGFAELTRSGAYHFAGCELPVINVDDSRIKAIETCLGTGESFWRAMKQLDYDIKGKKIVVFGCGKVGRGVVFYASRAGADVTAVDDVELVKSCIGGSLISRFDRRKIIDALRGAWCVVSAVGKAGALADEDFIEVLLEKKTLIANMSVEDDWGPCVPAELVLNRKQPLNFILQEPTLLRYIDPTMALHNHAAVELVRGNAACGLHPMTQSVHDQYWQAVEKTGIIAGELAAAGL